MRKFFIALLVITFLCQSAIAGNYFKYKADIFDKHVGTGTLHHTNGLNKGLTFYSDYDDLVLTTDYASGDPTTTFTSSRDATHPATYFNSSGVMQKTIIANVGRFNYGYYDATGYNTFTNPGLLVEGATTNYVTYGIFSADGGGGVSSGWTSDEDDTNAPTTTLVDVSSTFNVGTTVNAQRTQMTFSDGSYYQLYQLTGAGTFVQNDTVTVSGWIKGATSGLTVHLSYIEKDVGGVSGTSHTGADIAGSISSTEWRFFSYSTPAVDADCNKITARYTISAVDNADTMDLQIACFQVEKLPFASSFVPTTTAALTRNIEVLSYKTASNRTANQESCVVKLAPVQTWANDSIEKSVSRSLTKDRMFTKSATGTVFLFRPNNDDSAACLVTGSTTPQANTEYTAGYACQHIAPYAELYVNGISESTDVADDYTNPAWGATFSVGVNPAGSGTSLFGTIFEIGFWDRVLSVEEMKALHNLN